MTVPFCATPSPKYEAYWEALSEPKIEEALCATSYGADGAIALLHLGFAGSDLPPDAAFAVQFGGGLTERLLASALPPATPPTRLTARERDALALVADGKSDWEISVIMT